MNCSGAYTSQYLLGMKFLKKNNGLNREKNFRAESAG